jgi:hypothetical protein
LPLLRSKIGARQDRLNGQGRLFCQIVGGLKKRVRGVRKIERALEADADEESEVVRGYCAAVRSALTDDGRPPLAAPGLKLLGRLEAIRDSLEGLGRRRALPPPPWGGCTGCWSRG